MCFNEAGAGCPGIRHQLESGWRTCSASMRPGQAAPVFAGRWSGCMCAPSRFNEAGAGCPGIPIAHGYAAPAIACFNEAGAGCPGIRPIRATAQPG